MYAAATCRASILRGSTADEFGDEQDNESVAASGLLAHIGEKASRVFDSATQTARIVRTPYARMQSNTDIRPGDRLRDDTHNITYPVINVTQPSTLGRTSDLHIELRRVTPAE